MATPEQETRLNSWIKRHLPPGGAVTVEDRTGTSTILQLIGPKSQSLVSHNGISFCMSYHWRIPWCTTDALLLSVHCFSCSCSFRIKLTKTINWSPTFGVGITSPTTPVRGYQWKWVPVIADQRPPKSIGKTFLQQLGE